MEDNPRDPDFWLELADRDRKSAESELASGNYWDVFFHCQQMIEKRLKAVYALLHEVDPPKTHRLRDLAALCRLALSEPTERLFDLLERLYLSSRYGSAEIDEAKSRMGDILRQTEEVAEWVHTELKRLKSERRA